MHAFMFETNLGEMHRHSQRRLMRPGSEQVAEESVADITIHLGGLYYQVVQYPIYTYALCTQPTYSC